MNWAHDNVGLSGEDLDRVFKYESGDTTVIQILASNNWAAQIDSIESEKQWRSWVENDESLSKNDSGLVLLIAKRSGEQSLRGMRKATYIEWRNRLDDMKYTKTKMVRSDTFAALAQQQNTDGFNGMKPLSVTRREVRTLPFSKATFEMVAGHFHVHGSIAQVINRADIPAFTCEKVLLHQPAYVYNCRTSHAWDMDLALTITHFPGSRLTFAVLFGCPFAIEQEVITRLSHLTTETAHPLILPGLFAELERTRHVKLVENMGNEVETKIFELDSISADIDGPRGPQAQQSGIDKRRSFLDYAYLRNGLVSWNRQLARMARSAQQSIDTDFHNNQSHNSNPGEDYSRNDVNKNSSEDEIIDAEWNRGHSVDGIATPTPNLDSVMLQTVGYKIKSRVMAIHDEYDDKIRECTMRIDGMAMATQWAQGETTVEIALATNRDSRHMRSIALVTMIFLPGTFFASMFSMTFFNWSSDKDSPIVSTSLWIYFLITVFFTALTIGLWWYIVIFRPSRLRKLQEEEDQEKLKKDDSANGMLQILWQVIWPRKET